MKSIFKILPVLVLVCFLTACDEEVLIVQGLQKERDANEILVVLSTYQIKARKEAVDRNQETSWSIKVGPDDEEKARSVLVANSLPRVRLGGLKGICQEAGMIRSPKTEKCRELLGIKEEIINLLESIACVVSADVVLNIPEKEEFAVEDTPQPLPSATASVKYLKDCQTGKLLSEEQVQDIVANSVSGLDPRDVKVIISYMNTGLPRIASQMGDDYSTSQTTPTTPDCPEVVVKGDDGESVALTNVAGLNMDQDSASKFKVIALVFLILFLLITAAFIFVLLRISKIRKEGVAPTKALAPTGGDNE